MSNKKTKCSKVMMNVQLPCELNESIEKFAQSMMLSKSALVRMVLNTHVRNQQGYTEVPTVSAVEVAGE